jgi:hypothetical protein
MTENEHFTPITYAAIRVVLRHAEDFKIVPELFVPLRELAGVVNILPTHPSVEENPPYVVVELGNVAQVLEVKEIAERWVRERTPYEKHERIVRIQAPSGEFICFVWVPEEELLR